MNIRYNYQYADYGSGRWIEICIPMCNTDRPQPEGYIEDAPIDAYENACLHVKHTSTVYTDGNTRCEFGIRGNAWDSMYTDFGVGNYFYYTYDGDATRIYVQNFGTGGYRFYRLDNGGLIVPPDFFEIENLILWLENAGFDFMGSGRRFGTDYSSEMWVANPPVTKVCAYRALQTLRDQNPLEPSLSSLFFSLVAELKLNSNSLSNIAELSSIAVSLLNIEKTANKLAKKVTSDAIDKASDLWLAYRYTYSTTKADIEEAQRLILQLSSDSGILRGSCTVNNVDCKLKVRYAPYENEMLNSLYSMISSFQRMGLDPSMVNLWDMIPFSFVADWFIPIGDNLQRIADQKWAATMPYSTECLASIKGTVVVGEWEYSVYHRFDYDPSYDMSWIDDSTSTYKTWTKRVLDVAALKR